METCYDSSEEPHAEPGIFQSRCRLFGTMVESQVINYQKPNVRQENSQTSKGRQSINQLRNKRTQAKIKSKQRLSSTIITIIWLTNHQLQNNALTLWRETRGINNVKYILRRGRRHSPHTCQTGTAELHLPSTNYQVLTRHMHAHIQNINDIQLHITTWVKE